MNVGSIVSISDGLLVLVRVVDSEVDIILSSADSGVEDMVVVASSVVVAGEVEDSLDTAKMEMKMS